MGNPQACKNQKPPSSNALSAVLAGVFSLSLLVASPQLASADDSDVRIVIDVSGSMKQNDPDNLRVPALKVLAALLPEDTQAGVWTFGQYVNMLVKHGPANGAWKRQANISADGIGSIALRTNVGEALERVTWDLDSDSRRDRHILLLTDGRVDISDDPAVNRAEANRIIAELLPRLVDQGVRLHTIALSAQADVNFLKQLSIATGGYHAALTNPEELSGYFLKTLSAAAPPNEVSLGDDASFTIDNAVRQFTALLYRGPGQPTALVSPIGERLTRAAPGDDVRWYQDTEFDIVTVSKPRAGLWQAETGSDGRVSIVSDMSLAVGDIPTAIYPGYEGRIAVELRDQGRTINDEALLSVLTLEASYHLGDAPAEPIPVETPMSADGSFLLNLGPLNQPGDYAIHVRAVAPTFTRQRSLISSLRDPVSVSVERKGSNTAAVAVAFADANIDFTTLRLVGRVDEEGKSTQLKPLGDPEAGQWSLQLTTDGSPRTYDVAFDIRGKYLNGQEFNLRTGSVNVALPDSPPQALSVAMDGAVLRQEGAGAEDESPASSQASPVGEATSEQVPAQSVTGAEDSEPAAAIPWLTIALAALGTTIVAAIGGLVTLLLARRRKSAASDASQSSEEPSDTSADVTDEAHDFDSLLAGLDEACTEVGAAADAARQRAEAATVESGKHQLDDNVRAQDTDAQPAVPATATDPAKEAASEAMAQPVDTSTPSSDEVDPEALAEAPGETSPQRPQAEEQQTEEHRNDVEEAVAVEEAVEPTIGNEDSPDSAEPSSAATADAPPTDPAREAQSS